ncbi:UDP-glucuronate:xylan alpha-glucuronosyltransferase 2-like [Magnolia sinica]|uniref:UDP-glucuronate:xylan alpha-glucuronosyltransferase 2-like n=1 Tax=Magnolia sinica TaxID=86752 RepID=UPI0026581A74|nr:UDP-glucuronate:xylan alpha-glucuronosyltransferase 2-like [Magnolia sinica]
MVVSKTYFLKVKLSYISIFSLSLLFSVITYTSLLEQHQRVRHSRKSAATEQSETFNFLAKESDGTTTHISLVNMEEEEEGNGWIKWQALGNTTTIRFDRVTEDLRWEDFYPEWIDEDHKFNAPKCPIIPMPRFEEFGAFDAVIARVPCGRDPNKGDRDVFRLQVHLVVANLAVRSSRGDGRSVTVVLVGSCEPMWEIFRCDDLIKREGDSWVYRPDLKRLKQKLLMPVGSCQLAVPVVKHGQGKIQYDFSKIQYPQEHPRVAYATVLHSSERYVCGAIALAQSIIQTNSTKDLVLLADRSITKKSRWALKAAGWKIKMIERIRSPQAKKNAYNEWNYSKLRIWQLTEYDKIMFIDSDLIVLENLDRFFTMPQLSAAGNNGVLFNSGIMLIEPSNCIFEMLMNKRDQLVSYNGGDQGYLNQVFIWWHRLPGRLNRLKVFKRTHNRNGRDLPNAYAIHYLGFKPWLCYRDYDCNWDKKDHQIFASDLAHQIWWQVYDSMPTRLHRFCALSRGMDRWLKRMRERAHIANLDGGHWKIKVNDPRQLH